MAAAPIEPALVAPAAPRGAVSPSFRARPTIDALAVRPGAAEPDDPAGAAAAGSPLTDALAVVELAVPLGG